MDCVGSPKNYMQLIYVSLLLLLGNVDYDSGPYAVTFPAGMASTSFNVPIIDDNVVELVEQFDLTIDTSSLPNGFTVDDPSQVMVTITDDDSECYWAV